MITPTGSRFDCDYRQQAAQLMINRAILSVSSPTGAGVCHIPSSTDVHGSGLTLRGLVGPRPPAPAHRKKLFAAALRAPAFCFPVASASAGDLRSPIFIAGVEATRQRAATNDRNVMPSSPIQAIISSSCDLSSAIARFPENRGDKHRELLRALSAAAVRRTVKKLLNINTSLYLRKWQNLRRCREFPRQSQSGAAGRGVLPALVRSAGPAVKLASGYRPAVAPLRRPRISSVML